MAAEHLGGLSRDLLVEVLGRVDGASLASAACACTSLRGAAKEEALWAELCRRAWPSTADSTSRELVSSMPGGFAKLYADSLPLLIYKSRRPRGGGSGTRSAASSASDLISFVDVYYKKKCVLSRVVHGVPLHDDSARARPLECPFKVDAMGDLAVRVGDGGEETGARTLSIALEPKEEGGVGVLNWELEEDLTLSWVLLDVGSGRAVDLSGGRPTSVQRDCPSKGDMVVWFGCAVPVETQLLAAGAAECTISMRCRLSEEADDRLRCTGIELQVKDAWGAALADRRRSLAVLERALRWEERSRKRGAAAAGYRAYVKDCRETMEKGTGVVEKLFALAGLLLLLVACWVSLASCRHDASWCRDSYTSLTS